MKAPSLRFSGLGWTRNTSISSQRSGFLWLLVPLLRGWVCFSVYDSFGYQHVRMLQFGLLDGQSQGLVLIDIFVPCDDDPLLNPRLRKPSFHSLQIERGASSALGPAGPAALTGDLSEASFRGKAGTSGCLPSWLPQFFPFLVLGSTIAHPAWLPSLPQIPSCPP